jgi:predicted Zn-dependent peptidase
VLEVIQAELAAIAEGGVSAEELLRGKGQLRGSVVMGLEDTGAKMTRIAKAELVYGELPSVEVLLRRIDKVSAEDVGQLAAELYAGDQVLTVIGPSDLDSADFVI